MDKHGTLRTCWTGKIAQNGVAMMLTAPRMQQRHKEDKLEYYGSTLLRQSDSGRMRMLVLGDIAHCSGSRYAGHLSPCPFTNGFLLDALPPAATSPSMLVSVPILSSITSEA